jgi:hypothetical protein
LKKSKKRLKITFEHGSRLNEAKKVEYRQKMARIGNKLAEIRMARWRPVIAASARAIGRIERHRRMFFTDFHKMQKYYFPSRFFVIRPCTLATQVHACAHIISDTSICCALPGAPRR